VLSLARTLFREAVDTCPGNAHAWVSWAHAEVGESGACLCLAQGRARSLGLKDHVYGLGCKV